MSLDWPDIPFTGTEVTAFVNAYKELAESIYNDWDKDSFQIYSFPIDGNDNNGNTISRLKAPFRRKSTVKILLEYGLVYAAFIVKQRAGNAGPGTDFIIGNSPLTPPLTDGEKENILKNLGCTATEEEMEDAYRKNNGGKNPPENLTDDFQWLDDITEDTDPDNQTPKPEDPPEDCPDKNARENFYLTLANIPVFSGCYRDIKAKLLDRYLSCNDAVFTKDDLGGKANSLKNSLQNFMDSVNVGETQCSIFGNCVVHKKDITNNFTPEQKSRMGAGPTDKIYSANFYGDPGRSNCLHTLFGQAIVITSSSGTVKKLLDDFDFVYGNQVNRPDISYTGQSNPGKSPGTYYNPAGYQIDANGNPVPIGSPSAVGTTIYPPATQVSDVKNTQNAWDPAEIGRNIVATNFINGNGKGQPVPINLEF